MSMAGVPVKIFIAPAIKGQMLSSFCLDPSYFFLPRLGSWLSSRGAVAVPGTQRGKRHVKDCRVVVLWDFLTKENHFSLVSVL